MDLALSMIQKYWSSHRHKAIHINNSTRVLTVACPGTALWYKNGSHASLLEVILPPLSMDFPLHLTPLCGGNTW